MSSIWTVQRSATDHKVSGLAAGLARTWNVDPMLVRVGFAVLALSDGVGIVLYAAGWLMLPLEGKQQTVLEEAIPQTRNWSREVKVGIVVVAAIIGAVALSSLVPFSFIAALVVAAVWYFGYYRNRQQRTRSEPSTPRLEFAEFPGESTPFTEAAKAWQQRIAEYEELRYQSAEPTEPIRATAPAASAYGSGSVAFDAPTPTEQLPDLDHEAFLSHPDPVGLYSEPAPDTSAIDRLTQAKQLRCRSARRLGLISTIVLGAAMAGLGVASAAGATISVAGYLAVALLILGVTLLIASRVGRPPGLAFVTVLVAIAMILSLVAARDTAFTRDVGVRKLTYDAATVPASDHLRAGQLTVDLSRVRPDQARTYTASVDTGRLIVDLPDDATTDLTGTVKDGVILTDGQQVSSGPNLSFQRSAPAGTRNPVFTINLHVGNGQLEVRR